MLTGDFNARTSVLDDSLQVDLSLHIPVPDDYKVETVLDKRVSQDSKVNEYGRKLINLCISTGLRIVNGRLHEDKDMGKYTCIKNVVVVWLIMLLAPQICLNIYIISK